MHKLTFDNEDGVREALTVRGPRCVADWHAAKLRRQRVTRLVIVTKHQPTFELRRLVELAIEYGHNDSMKRGE